MVINMKKFLVFLLLNLFFFTINADDVYLYRIPERGPGDPTIESVRDRETGFWWSGEISSGYSVRFGKPNKSTAGFGELDVTAGYRFSEYLRVGPGIGLRYYFPAHHLRKAKSPLSMPIYLNVRGQFMSCLYRDVVPYYSFNIGGAVNDGFFIRPTIGLKFGTLRNSFLLNLSYLGQSLKTLDDPFESSFISFVCIGLGYEF